MSSEGSLVLTLDREKADPVRPGDRIAGTVHLPPDADPEAVELRCAWKAVGPAAVVVTGGAPAPTAHASPRGGPRGARGLRFEVEVPPGPPPFEGERVEVRWGVRARLLGSDGPHAEAWHPLIVEVAESIPLRSLFRSPPLEGEREALHADGRLDELDPVRAARRESRGWRGARWLFGGLAGAVAMGCTAALGAVLLFALVGTFWITVVGDGRPPTTGERVGGAVAMLVILLMLGPFVRIGVRALHAGAARVFNRGTEVRVVPRVARPGESVRCIVVLPRRRRPARPVEGARVTLRCREMVHWPGDESASRTDWHTVGEWSGELRPVDEPGRDGELEATVTVAGEAPPTFRAGVQGVVWEVRFVVPGRWRVAFRRDVHVVVTP